MFCVMLNTDSAVDFPDELLCLQKEIEWMWGNREKVQLWVTGFIQQTDFTQTGLSRRWAQPIIIITALYEKIKKWHCESSQNTQQSWCRMAMDNLALCHLTISKEHFNIIYHYNILSVLWCVFWTAAKKIVKRFIEMKLN